MSIWTTPDYSRDEVNKAGKVLIILDVSVEDYLNALKKINNWRTSHNFPLNTFQIRLRKKAKSVNEDCLIAQRINPHCS